MVVSSDRDLRPWLVGESPAERNRATDCRMSCEEPSLPARSRASEEGAAQRMAGAGGRRPPSSDQERSLAHFEGEMPQHGDVEFEHGDPRGEADADDTGIELVHRVQGRVEMTFHNFRTGAS